MNFPISVKFTEKNCNAIYFVFGSPKFVHSLGEV